MGRGGLLSPVGVQGGADTQRAPPPRMAVTGTAPGWAGKVPEVIFEGRF